MSQSRVSVLVPVYNMAGFLPECLKSVVSQDWEAMEVVVIDDGSTDGSGEFARGFVGPAWEEGRIAGVVCRPHEGKPGAIRAGLAASTGELVTIVDADDRLPAGSIRKRAEALCESRGWTGVYGDASYINRSGTVYRRRNSRPVSNVEQILGSMRSPIVGPSLMTRRMHLTSLLESAPPIRKAVDKYLLAGLSARGPMGYLPEIVYEYRTYRRRGATAARVRQFIDFSRVILLHGNRFTTIKLVAQQAMFHIIKLLFELVSPQK